MAAKTALIMMALLIGPVACVDPAPEDVARTAQEMRNETIVVHGCSPGFSEVTYGDGFACEDPWIGIGGIGGFGGFGWGNDLTKGAGGPRREPGFGDGGERAEEMVLMDPEPDRYKDRHSCEEWCSWNMHQCIKECWYRYPDPVRDFYTRQQCLTACKEAKDPNHGLEACRGDCQRRFPERPLTTVAP